MRQLSEACLDCRITPDELAARTEAVRAAGAIAERRCFTGDLPPPAMSPGPGAWPRTTEAAVSSQLVSRPRTVKSRKGAVSLLVFSPVTSR